MYIYTKLYIYIYIYIYNTYIHYITLQYITLHYNTLHYITLHYNTLHYITIHYITLHYIALHYNTLHYITIHYITYIHTTNPFQGSESNPLHFIKLPSDFPCEHIWKMYKNAIFNEALPQFPHHLSHRAPLKARIGTRRRTWSFLARWVSLGKKSRGRWWEDQQTSWFHWH